MGFGGNRFYGPSGTHQLSQLKNTSDLHLIDSTNIIFTPLEADERVTVPREQPRRLVTVLHGTGPAKHFYENINFVLWLTIHFFICYHSDHFTT